MGSRASFGVHIHLKEAVVLDAVVIGSLLMLGGVARACIVRNLGSFMRAAIARFCCAGATRTRG